MMSHPRCPSCGKPLTRAPYEEHFCDEKCWELRLEVIAGMEKPTSLELFAETLITLRMKRRFRRVG